MSFLKRLFSGSQGSTKVTETRVSIAHEGFEIVSSPQPEGQQFRLCGTISKEVDGAVKEHMLIRADLFSSHDEAVEATIRKAKQVIAEQGDRIFY